MAIYECECGDHETTFGDMKRHLRENPTHGTSGTFTRAYRRVNLHINMKGRNS